MMRVMKCAAVVGFGAWAAAMTLVAQGPATLTIQTDKPLAKVSPTLYGLMTEEINYSYEGGLYGEMVQDRTFLSRPNDTENWLPVPMGDAKGTVTQDKATGPSAA